MEQISNLLHEFFYSSGVIRSFNIEMALYCEIIRAILEGDAIGSRDALNVS